MELKKLSKLYEGLYSTAHVHELLSMPYFQSAKHMSDDDFNKSFVGTFVRRYPKYTHLLKYICAALHTDTPVWDDFTKVNLRAISDYINENVAPNSAVTYTHVIMAFLREYNEENVLPVRSLRGVMKSHKVPSQHVALTMDELQRFNLYVPRSIAERDVKCLFMRACYTGARCSDAYELSTKNIIDGKTISYVSKKTKVEVNLPLHSNLTKYLDYKITKVYSAKTTKDVIQRICRRIGVNQEYCLFVCGVRQTKPKWGFITMHSARRTFCTVLAQMGVNVETIRIMAGHTTSIMTDRYICLDGRNPGADAMRFFKGEPAPALQNCI